MRKGSSFQRHSGIEMAVASLAWYEISSQLVNFRTSSKFLNDETQTPDFRNPFDACTRFG
jgi:hypothetical protein